MLKGLIENLLHFLRSATWFWPRFKCLVPSLLLLISITCLILRFSFLLKSRFILPEPHLPKRLCGIPPNWIKCNIDGVFYYSPDSDRIWRDIHIKFKAFYFGVCGAASLVNSLLVEFCGVFIQLKLRKIKFGIIFGLNLTL